MRNPKNGPIEISLSRNVFGDRYHLGVALRYQGDGHEEEQIPWPTVGLPWDDEARGGEGEDPFNAVRAHGGEDGSREGIGDGGRLCTEEESDEGGVVADHANDGGAAGHGFVDLN